MPFRALGVANLEVRHGNFLADLCNPHGTHKFGDQILKAFLKPIFRTENLNAQKSDIIFKGLSNTIIRQEVGLKTAGGKFRKLNLLIELPDLNPKTVIFIELKIHAGESQNQLSDYYEHFSKIDDYEGWSRAFIFLTPLGDEASDPESWTALSLAEEVIPEFEKSLARLRGEPNAKLMLEAYVQRIREDFMENDILEALAARIWQEYPQALEFLADHRPDLKSDVYRLLWNGDHSGWADLKSKGYDLTGEWDSATNRRLLATLNNWDMVQGMCSGTDKRFASTGRIFWFEIDKNSSGIKAYFILWPGPSDVRQKLFQALLDVNANTGAKKSTRSKTDVYTRLGSEWLIKAKELESDKSAEELAELAHRRLFEFLNKELPLYDQAFKSLM